MKKISAILVAMVMLLSCISVAAVEAPEISLAVDGEVFNGDVFTVGVVISGATNFGGAKIEIDYDNTKVVPCNEDGSVTYSAFDAACVVTKPAGLALDDAVISAVDSAAKLQHDFGYTSQVSTAIEGEYVIASYYFKAIGLGDSGLAIGETYTKYLADSYDEYVATTFAATDVTVEARPTVAPVVSDVTVTGLKSGATATVTYTYEDANEGRDDADVSEVVIKVDGVAVDVELTGDAPTYTFPVADAWVGKTLTAEVTATADRSILADGNTDASEGAIVLPADDYVPAIDTETVTLSGETIVTLDTDLAYGYTNKYEVAEDNASFAWYIVEADSLEAALVATLEGDPYSTDEVTSFDVADMGKYAVVVITPSVIVGETEYPIGGVGAVEVKAATLISAQLPEITEEIDETATIRSGKILKADASFENNYNGATADEELVAVTYLWEVFAPAADEESEEEIIETGEAYEFKLTKDFVGYNVRVTIGYTNGLGVDAEPVTVLFENTVEKASGTAPAVGGPSLTEGTTTPVEPSEPTEPTEPSEPTTPSEPVTPADPAGSAIEAGAAAFTDVNKDAYAWAYEGIDALAKAGVIKGMTETTFGPELKASNAQMIALAVRIAGLTAEGATTDKVAADHWVAGELAVADAKGVLAVYGDKAIDADGDVTREVAFTLLYNALKAAGVELKADAEAIEYTDASSIDAACVEAIEALTKAGIVNGMGDGTLAPKATLTRAQLAKILGIANTLLAK